MNYVRRASGRTTPGTLHITLAETLNHGGLCGASLKDFVTASHPGALCKTCQRMASGLAEEAGKLRKSLVPPSFS